jgi:uncharacterized protein
MASGAAEDLKALRAWMRQFDTALVAYSGGVDSALVLACASLELGPGALGVIGDSPSLARRELGKALESARSMGFQTEVVQVGELSLPDYRANRPDRCYHCKKALFRELRKMASEGEYQVILDGSNAEDREGDRPGIKAAREEGVRSPLRELRFSKEAVKAMARSMQLPQCDKPPMACLSSRIPNGVEITVNSLARVEAAEACLEGMGFRQTRVRDEYPTARIEVPSDDMDEVMRQRRDIAVRLRSLGYRHVAMDLSGYQRT